MKEQTKYTFDVNGDYKSQFETYVNTLITSLRESDSSAISKRDVRAKEIKSLTDAYVASIGQRPEPKQLERLADLLMREELSDSRPDKTTLEEYPILSEYQLDRRRDKEVPLIAAEEHGTDGRNYKPPLRRKRTRKETWKIDRDAKSKNMGRRKKYREFTKVQPVKVLRKYADWLPLLEREQNVKVLDDDGGRMLYNEGKYDELLTKDQAQYYFMFNTIMGRVDNSM
ncbi:hypothetical protein IEO_03071 [Bacillus wiedmannii]|uniref:hypothetical protein n=1 Tax=Bacillus wiedmannii TaxID=1890302 RepID=UPI00027C0167|nr:hypothetical protein [Bacillus wiedmannii]EJV61776.1 hypothetical protein IEO_03071 [Bacillus wiedmannii]